MQQAHVSITSIVVKKPNKTSARSVLVIDDHYAVVSPDFYSREDFKNDFSHLPFRFNFASAMDSATGRYTVSAAIDAVRDGDPDGILLDVMFGENRGDRLGIAILEELTREFPQKPVVMMTSLTRDDVWEECSRLGAVDYLPKPLDARLLRQTLDRYVGTEPDHWLIGQDRQFLDAVNLAALAAEGGQTSVLITGETGTGKELFARYIHRHGKRSGKPFETIYLPNIPGDMQAANLFGYRKGAFTGADRDEQGRFAAADGGIAFLDEIGDIDQETQLRLLRVADTGEMARLGDGKSRQVDVQIITATNADLARRIKAKEFRYDLWSRLSGMPIALPALSQRKDDIPILVRHLLRCQALKRKKQVPILPRSAEEALKEFPWHGNVRGLRAYAQRVFDLAGDGQPGEALFIAALPSMMDRPPHEAGDVDLEHDVAPVPKTAVADVVSQIQNLRMEELAVLNHALERTRDQVTGALNRAKAAAMLTGKRKCSTNVFDRRVAAVWDDLTEESRQKAVTFFPNMLSSLKNQGSNK